MDEYEPYNEALLNEYFGTMPERCCENCEHCYGGFCFNRQKFEDDEAVDPEYVCEHHIYKTE